MKERCMMVRGEYIRLCEFCLIGISILFIFANVDVVCFKYLMLHF